MKASYKPSLKSRRQQINAKPRGRGYLFRMISELAWLGSDHLDTTPTPIRSRIFRTVRFRA
jgi:hypothetical protein